MIDEFSHHVGRLIILLSILVQFFVPVNYSFSDQMNTIDPFNIGHSVDSQ